MDSLQHNIPNAQNKTKVHVSVTLAVAVSLVLIMAGIWNAYKTGLIAEENIKASLQLQRLSDSIRFHQESMSGAIEFALTTGEAHWHTGTLAYQLRNQPTQLTGCHACHRHDAQQ